MAEELRARELQLAERALARGDDPRKILAQLSRAITNKLIHAPTTGLKQASADGRQDLINNARKLLGLEGSAPLPAADEALEQAEPDVSLPEVETTRRTLQ